MQPEDNWLLRYMRRAPTAANDCVAMVTVDGRPMFNFIFSGIAPLVSQDGEFSAARRLTLQCKVRGWTALNRCRRITLYHVNVTFVSSLVLKTVPFLWLTLKQHSKHISLNNVIYGAVSCV